MTDADTKTNLSYDDYLEAVIINQMRHMNWRLGQTAFNVLSRVRPDIAENVRGSSLDPFYADHMQFGYEKVANFLAHVRENW